MNKKQLKKIRRAKLLKKKQHISKNIISSEAIREIMKSRIELYSAPANDGMTQRIVTLNELKVLNQESEDLGYNRGLLWDEFLKEMKKGFNEIGQYLGADVHTTFLVPLMVHEHKGGEKCDKHIRCEVFSDYFIQGFLTLDVAWDSFMELRTINVPVAKQAISEYRKFGKVA
jgi:hypothetical protein